MPTEEQIKIAEMELMIEKYKNLEAYTEKVGKLSFLVAKVFQENDANISDVYLVFGLVLGKIHSKNGEDSLSKIFTG